jgi:hypothetical protein
MVPTTVKPTVKKENETNVNPESKTGEIKSGR